MSFDFTLSYIHYDTFIVLKRNLDKWGILMSFKINQIKKKNNFQKTNVPRKTFQALDRSVNILKKKRERQRKTDKKYLKQ